MKNFSKLLTVLGSIVALLSLVAGTAIGVVPSGTLAGKILVTKGKKSENTIVYLKGVEGNYEPPQNPAVLDQKGKVFTPHLLPVQKGQTVRFNNSDPLTHNVHLYWGRRSMLNRSQPPNSSFDWTPPRTGEYLILCNMHPEMMAVLLVFNHPFFSAVPSSEFKIDNIPEGTYTLVGVREVRGKLKEQETEVSIKAGETARVTIKF